MTLRSQPFLAALPVANLPITNLHIDTLKRAYANGLKPSTLIHTLLPQLALHDCDGNSDSRSHQIWISRFSKEQLLERTHELESKNPTDYPLYGIPFAVKDNIDVAGLPTTAACPAFAYTPTHHAHVVQRLVDAGAIVLGKTNLDQFATGLNGTRTPYGIPRNSIDPAYISGGSSSGSALAVAMTLASFSLGTDTAGSGRIPAAFNALIGVKPSCGLLSNTGAVPACRSLDSISIFTQTSNDAEAVLAIATGYDATDSYSKAFANTQKKSLKTLGVPYAHQLAFFDNHAYAQLFTQAKLHATTMGLTLIEIDFFPFLAAAELLYAGPWVAERYLVVQALLKENPEAVLPVIAQIIAKADQFSAVDTFNAFYQLAALKRQCDNILASVDAILTPTAGTIYTIKEMLANPIICNTNLGYYTNFMNLLDYSALALPAGNCPDGMPFGVTVFGHSGEDFNLLSFAHQWQAAHTHTSTSVMQKSL